MTTENSRPITAFIGALLSVLLVLGALALVPWLAMLLIGALHLNVIAALPAFGFWQSVLIVVALGFFGAIWNASVTRS